MDAGRPSFAPPLSRGKPDRESRHPIVRGDEESRDSRAGQDRRGPRPGVAGVGREGRERGRPAQEGTSCMSPKEVNSMG
jgi:hypothetical protein